MQITRPANTLSTKDKQKLLYYLREAQNRGLPVAEILRKRVLENTRPWHTDSNGYFVRRDGKLFKPYEEQQKFLASKARFALFLGGRGSGKSASGAQKAVKKLSLGLPGLVVNPRFEDFKDSTWPEFRDWIPWNHVVVQHQYRADPAWEPQRPFKLVFDNGAFAICKGLNNPDSARGPNLNWFWYDEGQKDETGDAWNTANASVRIGENPQAWVTATGRGTYHWMYEFFEEKAFPQNVLDAMEELSKILPPGTPFIEWFHGTIYDNQANLDPGFFAAILSQYPMGAGYEQEVLGQFADPGGNRGDAKWFDGRVLEERPPEVESRIRYWDLAASEKKVAGRRTITDPDETVGTLMSHYIDKNLKDKYQNQFVIEDQISGTWEWAEIKKRILDAARKDGPFVVIYIEEEPGSGGINQVAQIREEVTKELTGWTVRGHNPRKEGGDKIVRADIWFAEACENVNHPVKQFWLVKGEWNQGFLRQLSSFPSARHDDKIDSVSGARICIAPIQKWVRMEFMHLGMKIEEDKKVETNDIIAL